METKITVRYGNDIMEEGETCISGRDVFKNENNPISYWIKLFI